DRDERCGHRVRRDRRAPALRRPRSARRPWPLVRRHRNCGARADAPRVRLPRPGACGRRRGRRARRRLRARLSRASPSRRRRPRAISGADEAEALARLPPPDDREVEQIAHLVLMALLPALADDDLATFGRALTAIQMTTGRWFAPVQGGAFAPGPSAELVRRM